MVTSLNQRNQIQEFIQTELLKRGFTAPIINFEEVKGRHDTRIEFYTETFQTVPVLFKEIQVSNFSSSITKDTITRKDDSKIDIHKVWIVISARYESFTGGTNGTNLFSITCTLHDGKVFDLKTI